MIKGVSWRILASADTFVVSLLVTWALQGEPSVATGIKIVAVEFILKFLIYYAHERVWQFAWKDGRVHPRETLFKSITWRVVATLTTFVIAYFILEDTGAHVSRVAGVIAGVELVTKFILYFLHERLWLRIPLGTVRNMVKK